ncbi:MAG TPA: phytanoyl-CoA dioxygenase family protein [Acidimicrobiales bacterium]|nr:phytanoyl-CoA dioxygenase family protein [Acidimicrobiales bacterium]
MRDEERYLFDLQGYLTVPDALSPDAVDELNDAVDELVQQEMSRDETTRRWIDLLPRSRVFRDLMDNPRVFSFLEELLGPGLRLDHEYIDVIRSGLGPIGARLHGGATPFNPVQYYWTGHGILRSGLLVAAYNLKDVGPEDGGFACVPGSHKSAFPFPENWKDLSHLRPCVRRVTGPAGTAIIFTEALTHGTLPWRGSDERRTVFYKYSPEPLAWSRRYYDPDAYPELTETQRNLLRPPGRSPAVGYP